MRFKSFSKSIAALITAAMVIPCLSISVLAKPTIICDIDSNNFPDNTFRNYVLEYIDTDGDNKLSTDEAHYTSLIDYSKVSVNPGYRESDNLIGLNNFPDLIGIHVNLSDKCTSLDLSAYSKLADVNVKGINLASLTLPASAPLNALTIESSKLTTLDVSDYGEMVLLNLNCPNLTTLTMGMKNSAIKFLTLYSNNLINCNMGFCSLEVVELGGRADAFFDESCYPNLVQLTASCSNTNYFDFSSNPYLQEVILFANENLTSIDTSNNAALKRLLVSGLNISSINPSSNTNLEQLRIIGSSISTLDLSNCSNLSWIDIEKCPNLSNLDISKQSDLYSLTLRSLGNTSINLAESYPYITSLNITDSNITSFDANRFPNAETIDLSNTKIPSLNTSNLPKLQSLQVSDSPLASITLNNPKLAALNLQNTSITSINLSSCPLLGTFYAPSTLKTIDIRQNPSLIACYTNGTHTPANDSYIYESYKYMETLTIDGSEITRYDVFSFAAGTTIITGNSVPVTPTPVPTPIPSPTPEGGVAGFVERLYTVALGRPSEPTGKANWIAAIRGGETGAEVAKGFLFSDEFLNKNMSDEDFVKILYRTFFDREAEAAGLAAWVAALGRGESKQDVIMGFINSTEWANVCLRYGIFSGGTGTPSIVVEPNSDIIAFATRLYTTCLKRTPDNAGLMAWARQLANLRDTGTNAAHGFFFSDEMLNNPVSNEEYVTRLYLTFMDRSPDEAGFNAWVGQLNSGVSREEVFQGFAQSTEFGTICANYGIIR